MKRGLSWFLTNAFFGLLLWYGAIRGNAGVLRILDVFIALFVVAAIAMNSDAMKESYWKRHPEGPPIPRILDTLFDMAVISLLAYFDHLWLAAGWVIVFMFSQSLHEKPDTKEGA